MALSQMTDSRDESPLRRALRPAGPVNLTLAESRRAGTTIISVRGELDILTAPKVGARLDEVVRTRSGDVVVDLRETEFVDSAGLYVLLNAHRRLRQRSRGMTVVCGAGPARRVLELSRVTETLGVVSSLEELDESEPAEPPATTPDEATPATTPDEATPATTPDEATPPGRAPEPPAETG